MKNISPPQVKLEHFKRTKIIATIGPSTNDYESISNIMDAGVNGFRLNFSHGTHEEKLQHIDWIRQASQEQGKPVAIIADLQGPKMRLGDFDEVVKLQAGQRIRMSHKGDYERDGIIPTQHDLSSKAEGGHRVLLVDGRIKGRVSHVENDVLHVDIENEGELTQRKGTNLPDTSFAGEIITEKDKEDLAVISEADVDYVAMSFVQSAEDIKQMQQLISNLGSDAKVIAKIETMAAVENIESIVETADAVMVARGDLAIETEPEAVPVITRSIIELCQQHQKVSVVATQMLMSMTQSPEPTRAEASDVATAVIVGADCVMLSDETASGKYPLEAVTMMKRIVMYTQDNAHVTPEVFTAKDDSVQGAISSAVISLAHQVGACAILAKTKSGRTALNISAHRPIMPLLILASVPRVAQQSALVYGGITFLMPAERGDGWKLLNWLEEEKVFEKDDIVVAAMGVRPGISGGTDTIKIRRIGSQDDEVS